MRSLECVNWNSCLSLPQGARAVIAGEGAGVGEVTSAARARNLLDEEEAEHGGRAH